MNFEADSVHVYPSLGCHCSFFEVLLYRLICFLWDTFSEFSLPAITANLSQHILSQSLSHPLVIHLYIGNLSVYCHIGCSDLTFTFGLRTISVLFSRKNMERGKARRKPLCCDISGGEKGLAIMQKGKGPMAYLLTLWTPGS